MVYEFDGYIPNIHNSSYIHPSADIIGNVIIGKEVYIGPNASLRGDFGKIIVEDGCNIQENCTIHMFPGEIVHLKKKYTYWSWCCYPWSEIRSKCIGRNKFCST